MNWKRNPTLVMGLCAALGVSIIIIAILIIYKGGATTQTPPSPQAVQPQQRIPPPPSQQRPPPPPSAPPAEATDYHTTIGSGKPALVLFYADWCGHSKNILPAWEKVSQILNGSGQFEAIALEQKQHKAEMQKHNVQGFPDIRFYPEGFPSQNSIPYRGNRSPESLMKFAQSGGQEM